MSERDTSGLRRVCAVNDVSPESPEVVEVDGQFVAVFESDGEYYALDNACPHQGGPLGQGKVEDECVYCPWHGWQFDVETGEHVQGIEDATSYEVTVDSGDVYVAL